MKVDLHLISWNRPKMTELVIKTIHKNTPRDDFRLVVLDNASDESTVQMLEKLHENGLIDELISIKTNLGLEAARNLLLHQATQGEYFVCVDNDCLPQEGWLEGLLDLMEKNEGYAAISLRTQVMVGTGNIFEQADENGDELVDFPHPGGSFRLMRTGDVLAVDGWVRPMAGNPDDFHAPGRGAEERLVCGKLRELGCKTAFAVNLKCLHLFGVREQTKERWGYDETMSPEDSGHSDISHPALDQGDNFERVKQYAGGADAVSYFA